MSIVSKLAKIKETSGHMVLGDITADKVGWLIKSGDQVIGYASNKEKAKLMMRNATESHQALVLHEITHAGVVTVQ